MTIYEKTIERFRLDMNIPGRYPYEIRLIKFMKTLDPQVTIRSGGSKGRMLSLFYSANTGREFMLEWNTDLIPC